MVLGPLSSDGDAAPRLRWLPAAWSAAPGRIRRARCGRSRTSSSELQLFHLSDAQRADQAQRVRARPGRRDAGRRAIAHRGRPAGLSGQTRQPLGVSVGDRARDIVRLRVQGDRRPPGERGPDRPGRLAPAARAGHRRRALLRPGARRAQRRSAPARQLLDSARTAATDVLGQLGERDRHAATRCAPVPADDATGHAQRGAQQLCAWLRRYGPGGGAAAAVPGRGVRRRAGRHAAAPDLNGTQPRPTLVDQLAPAYPAWEPDALYAAFSASVRIFFAVPRSAWVDLNLRRSLEDMGHQLVRFDFPGWPDERDPHWQRSGKPTTNERLLAAFRAARARDGSTCSSATCTARWSTPRRSTRSASRACRRSTSRATTCTSSTWCATSRRTSTCASCPSWRRMADFEAVGARPVRIQLAANPRVYRPYPDAAHVRRRVRRPALRRPGRLSGLSARATGSTCAPGAPAGSRTSASTWPRPRPRWRWSRTSAWTASRRLVRSRLARQRQRRSADRRPAPRTDTPAQPSTRRRSAGRGCCRPTWSGTSRRAASAWASPRPATRTSAASA